MKIETEIRDILGGNKSPEGKAKLICRLMSWKEEKVLYYVKKLRINHTAGRSEFIKQFWG